MDAASWLGLEEKAVLLVGAGAFGRALTRAFRHAGAQVCVADIDEGNLKLAVESAGGADVHTHVTDLSSAAECSAMVDHAAGLLGGLDVVVHAVGVNYRESALDVSEQSWEETLRLNLSSCFWVGQRAGEVMMRAGTPGRMVFFSSVSGLLGHPKHVSYAASKGGMNQMIKVMAVEMAHSGIAVNAVAPGYAVTPLTEEYCAQPGVLDMLVARVPMGRLAAADDIVGPTLFLSSQRAAYVTGQVLYVDGGRTLD